MSLRYMTDESETKNEDWLVSVLKLSYRSCEDFHDPPQLLGWLY